MLLTFIKQKMKRGQKKNMRTIINKTKLFYTYVVLGLLSVTAILFANAACNGRIYEPKVPGKLRK